eukprot:2921407-Ditylum_brightwellii.AAC.1
MQGKTSAESMIVKLGGDIFKGEGDVQAWMEENLPGGHPFGAYVDVYVVLDMILVGHMSVQAATMERNYKLN